MKKLFLIIAIIIVVILSISLFLIFNNKEDDIKLKDYSYVNVEEIKVREFNTLANSEITLKDIRINNGYLEGIVLINSSSGYDVLNLKLVLYDENNNVLDEINFKFENVLPYEERDLFYPIQKDLSNARYVDIKKNK